MTIATDSPDLLHRAGEVFTNWRARLTEVLQEGGLEQRQAERFAATLVAASEGAVVAARAEQSMAPFDLVAEELVDRVRGITAGVR